MGFIDRLKRFLQAIGERQTLALSSVTVDLTNGKAVREFVETALELLETSSLDNARLNHLRRQALQHLDRQQRADAPRLSQCVNAIDVVLAEVEETAVTGGLVAAQQGNLERAEEQLTLGLKIAELRDSDSLLAMALIGIGLVYKRRNDLLSAEDSYRQALTIADEIGDLSLKSGALDNLANVYLAMGLSGKALECYEAALDAANRDGDVHGELSVLNNLSMIYLGQREFDRAVEVLKQVIEQAHSVGRFDAEAVALDNLAHVLTLEGRLDEAEQPRLRALQLFLRLERPHDEYIALVNLSGHYMIAGRTALAGSYFERAADVIRRLRNDINIDRYTIGRRRALLEMERQGLAQLTREQQGLLETRGQEGPIEAFVRELAVYPEARIGAMMLLGEQSLHSGSEKLERHRYEEAESDLKIALAAFRDIGAYSEEVAVANDLGVLYLELGDRDQALNWLLHARKLAREMGDLLREVNVLGNLARLYTEFKLGAADALDMLTQAELLLDLWPQVVEWHKREREGQDAEAERSKDKTRGDFSKAMLVYGGLGNCHRDHGSYRRAESYYLRAVKAAEQYLAEESNRAGTYRLIYRLVNLYRLYCLTNETGKLRQILEQIRSAAARSDDLKGEFMAAIMIGEYHAEIEGELEQAYDMFKYAIELSDSLREQVPRGEERIGFVGYIMPPFQTATSLAIRLGRWREAFNLIEHSKSRQLLDALAETLPRSASEIPPSMLEKERCLFGRWMEALGSFQEAVPDKPDRSLLQTAYQASEDIRELRSELERIWDELEPIDSEYVSLRRGSPLHLGEIRQMLFHTRAPESTLGATHEPDSSSHRGSLPL